MKTRLIIGLAVVVVGLGAGTIHVANSHNDSKPHSKVSKKTSTKSSSEISSSVSSSMSSESTESLLSSASSESSVTPVTSSMPSQLETSGQGANYDPNKDANGDDITTTDVATARKELISAGLPADQFSDGDIMQMIRKASEENVSLVQFAKDNYTK
ncbi:hypothetical protein [Weissella confusa]|uniref:hypothetical protein n=1 Tax=Weissella confusa TaxID=1583 RepID=UPI002E1C6A68|nr:hypothetical protein [Weissella confusa]